MISKSLYLASDIIFVPHPSLRGGTVFVPTKQSPCPRCIGTPKERLPRLLRRLAMTTLRKAPHHYCEESASPTLILSLRGAERCGHLWLQGTIRPLTVIARKGVFCPDAAISGTERPCVRERGNIKERLLRLTKRASQ